MGVWSSQKNHQTCFMMCLKKPSTRCCQRSHNYEHKAFYYCCPHIFNKGFLKLTSRDNSARSEVFVNHARFRSKNQSEKHWESRHIVIRRARQMRFRSRHCGQYFITGDWKHKHWMTYTLARTANLWHATEYFPHGVY